MQHHTTANRIAFRVHKESRLNGHTRTGPLGAVGILARRERLVVGHGGDARVVALREAHAVGRRASALHCSGKPLTCSNQQSKRKRATSSHDEPGSTSRQIIGHHSNLQQYTEQTKNNGITSQQNRQHIATHHSKAEQDEANNDQRSKAERGTAQQNMADPSM